MTIITKPSAIDKGVENVITLNKADLASDTKVVADSYYSDQNNWKNVYITYKTPEGQVNDVIFDASEASPTGSFNPSLKARDTWEVQSVTIQDFDNGSLKLLRGDLTVAEFDIALGSLPVAFISQPVAEGLSNFTSASQLIGQTLTVTSSKTITSVKIGIEQSVPNAGSVQVLFYSVPSTTDVSGKSLIATSNPFDVSQLSAYDLHEFSFVPFNVATGTYYIELILAGITTFNSPFVVYNSNSSLYTDGVLVVSGTTPIGSLDLTYEVLGTDV